MNRRTRNYNKRWRMVNTKQRKEDERLDRDKQIAHSTGECLFDVCVLVYNLHRNHSLTRSVYVPPDGGDGDEDDHRYEDSDFGVPLPVTDLTASTGARFEHGLHPENPELIEPPQIEEQTHEADKKPKPFIQPVRHNTATISHRTRRVKLARRAWHLTSFCLRLFFLKTLVVG